VDVIFHFFSPSVPKGVQDVTQRQGIAIVPPKKRVFADSIEKLNFNQI
jgi:hypothetical protein